MVINNIIHKTNKPICIAIEEVCTFCEGHNCNIVYIICFFFYYFTHFIRLGIKYISYNRYQQKKYTHKKTKNNATSWPHKPDLFQTLTKRRSVFNIYLWSGFIFKSWNVFVYEFSIRMFILSTTWHLIFCNNNVNEYISLQWSLMHICSLVLLKRSKKCCFEIAINL